MENILKDIAELHARNKRVEAEKAWETSWQRKTLIVAITYIFMLFFMNLIGVEKPWINALVPTLGFFLSTLSVDFLKKKYIVRSIGKFINNIFKSKKLCKIVNLLILQL